MVRPFTVDWYRALRRQVLNGRKLFLAYNLSSYDEDPTDPSAVIDRLYLSLGHDRFVQSVWVFGNQTERWNHLPIRPLGEFADFVQTLDPDEFVGEWLYHPADDDQSWEAARVHRAELKQMFAALEDHFDLRWNGPERDLRGRERWRFTLHRKNVTAR
jgi:hypothetical protein